MPAYDPQTVEKFAIKAYKEGRKNIEVIIAKYEENFYMPKAVAFHHNILLKSGKKQKSLCDLTSLNGFNENETTALKEAAEAVKQIADYKILKVTLQEKVVGYSWFLDKPKLN
jgi:hypothetical protein